MRSPAISPTFVATAIAHLDGWQRYTPESFARYGGRVGEINQQVLAAMTALEALHLELTGDYSPRRKAEDCFED